MLGDRRYVVFDKIALGSLGSVHLARSTARGASPVAAISSIHCPVAVRCSASAECGSASAERGADKRGGDGCRRSTRGV